MNQSISFANNKQQSVTFSCLQFSLLLNTLPWKVSHFFCDSFSKISKYAMLLCSQKTFDKTILFVFYNVSCSPFKMGKVSSSSSQDNFVFLLMEACCCFRLSNLSFFRVVNRLSEGRKEGITFLFQKKKKTILLYLSTISSV